MNMLHTLVMVMPDYEGSNNDGPGDPDGTRRRIRSHVFVASAFALAMGLTFLVFFLLFHIVGLPDGPIGDFFEIIIPNIFLAFLYGTALGGLMAFIYNGLVAHHFNIFNIDAEDYA